MSWNVEFGTIDDANEARAEYGEWLHESDDLRTKTVRFEEETPGDAREKLREDRLISKSDESKSYGQQKLSEGERDRLRKARRNWNWQDHGFEAMHAKAALLAEGAADWMNYYEVGEGAEGSLKNLEAGKERSAESGAGNALRGEHRDEETTEAEMGRAMEKARGEGCNHAENHCENGDPEACEFLREECGVDPAVVDRLMGTDEFDEELPDDSIDELTGPQAGALSRSWGGYRGAVAALEEDLADVRESLEHAEQAVRAIHAIEGEAGLEETTRFDRLEDHHETLAELATAHPGASHGQPEGPEDVQEETDESCGCDHDPGGDHPHGVSEDDLEAATEAVHDAGTGPEKKAAFMTALEEWAEEYPPDAVAEGADNLAFLTLGRPNDTVNVRKAVDQALAEVTTDPEDVLEEPDEMGQRDLAGETVASEGQATFAGTDDEHDPETLEEQASEFGVDDRSASSGGSEGREATLGEATGGTDAPEPGQGQLGGYERPDPERYGDDGDNDT